MNFCKKCGKETKNPSFCSHSCSASYNNTGKIKRKQKFCISCGRLIDRHNQLYCSPQCQGETIKKNVINDFINEKNREFLNPTIRKYILESNNYSCEICGWSRKNPYNGVIYLDIHHIDGNRKNNRINNLQVLCQNCHSLTGTFRGMNRKDR